MTLLAILGAILTLSLELLKMWNVKVEKLDKKEEIKREIKTEAIKDAVDAISNKNASSLNLALQRLRE